MKVPAEEKPTGDTWRSSDTAGQKSKVSYFQSAMIASLISIYLSINSMYERDVITITVSTHQETFSLCILSSISLLVHTTSLLQ
jgi:hypothetical protein